MLKAVIFDLDGVVADSHPIHEVAWKALLKEQGLDPAAMNLEFLYAGHSRSEILSHFLGPLDPSEVKRLGQRKDQLYAAAEKTLETKPGIPRVLSQLRAAGILCALATSAGRLRTQQSLKRFGITQRFSVVITGEDVNAAKPAPDIFLLAAERLGVAPRDCIVVEDSVAGIQSAIAACMRCVGFAPPQRIQELRLAGAQDLISELPEDAVRYFQDLFRRVEPQAITRGNDSFEGRNGSVG